MVKRRHTTRIVIHCSATKMSLDIGAADIDEWHRASPNHFAEIGYAAVIRRDGRIEFGRHFDEQGAHVRGHNADTLGICLVGGLHEDGRVGQDFYDTFTDEQARSLFALLLTLHLAYPGAEIVGHRDLSPDANRDGVITREEWLKDCPTFNVKAFLTEEGFFDVAR